MVSPSLVTRALSLPIASTTALTVVPIRPDSAATRAETSTHTFGMRVPRLKTACRIAEDRLPMICASVSRTSSCTTWTIVDATCNPPATAVEACWMPPM